MDQPLGQSDEKTSNLQQNLPYRKKLVIDGTSLKQPRTGIGKYTYENIKTLSISEYSIFIFSSDSTLVNDFGEARIKIINNKWFARFGSFFNYHFILPYYLKKIKPEVFWSPTHRLPIFLDKDQFCITTIHDLVWKSAPQTMKRTNLILEKIFFPIAIKRSNSLISVSKNTQRILEEHFPKAKHKISIIHPIRPYIELKSATDVKLKYGAPDFILSVGTNEPRKNLVSLIKAYSKLSDLTRNKVKLIVVGSDGWGNVDLKGAILDNSIHDGVIFLGYVDEEELIKLYDECLFLAYPSIHEGFGLPILEAMARGKPVLTSSNSSMPEVAGKAAEYVDPHSVKSIFSGLQKLINDSEYRKYLSALATEEAMKYDNKKALELFLELLNQQNG